MKRSNPWSEHHNEEIDKDINKLDERIGANKTQAERSWEDDQKVKMMEADIDAAKNQKVDTMASERTAPRLINCPQQAKIEMDLIEPNFDEMMELQRLRMELRKDQGGGSCCFKRVYHKEGRPGLKQAIEDLKQRHEDEWNSYCRDCHNYEQLIAWWREYQTIKLSMTENDELCRLAALNHKSGGSLESSPAFIGLKESWEALQKRRMALHVKLPWRQQEVVMATEVVTTNKDFIPVGNTYTMAEYYSTSGAALTAPAILSEEASRASSQIVISSQGSKADFIAVGSSFQSS